MLLEAYIKECRDPTPTAGISAISQAGIQFQQVYHGAFLALPALRLGLKYQGAYLR